MGLLESLAGGLIGADEKDDAAKKGVSLNPAQVSQFVQGAVAVVKKIGLQGLIEKFKSAGLADQVMSWIGKGQNQPVTGEQVESALGPGIIGELAKKTGLEKTAAAAALARYLPKVMDILTPDGKPDEAKASATAGGFNLGELEHIAGSLEGKAASFLGSLGKK